MTFHPMCDHIIFNSVSVAEWPPFLVKFSSHGKVVSAI